MSLKVNKSNPIDLLEEAVLSNIQINPSSNENVSNSVGERVANAESQMEQHEAQLRETTEKLSQQEKNLDQVKSTLVETSNSLANYETRVEKINNLVLAGFFVLLVTVIFMVIQSFWNYSKEMANLKDEKIKFLENRVHNLEKSTTSIVPTIKITPTPILIIKK